MKFDTLKIRAIKSKIGKKTITAIGIIGSVASIMSLYLFLFAPTSITMDNVKITKKLPENFLNEVNIGTSIEYVKEKFGPPLTYFEAGDTVQLGYEFENLNIVIHSNHEKKVDAILINLKSLKKKYPIYPIYRNNRKYILGKLKFKDINKPLENYNVMLV